MSNERMQETFEDENNANNNNKQKYLYIGAAVISVLVLIFVLFPKSKKVDNINSKNQIDTVQTGKKKIQKLVFQKENKNISGKEKIDITKFKKEYEEKHNNELENNSQYNSNIPPVVQPTKTFNKPVNMNFNSNIPSEMSNPPKEYKYKHSRLMSKRLDPDFQAMVEHLTSNRNRGSWELPKSEYKKFIGQKDVLKKVEEPLRDLYVGANKTNNSSITLGSGTRIRAITDQDVNSNHPGAFTAKIIRPYELKGATLICKSGSNVNNRIPCSIEKLITRNGEEVSISGQIDMNGIIGLEGRVHWKGYKRIIPAIANAGIGGAFVAWQMQNEVDSVRIDSRDAVQGPIIQSSIQELQNEITNLGGDYPDVVKVKKGSNFTILLTSSFKVKI